MRLPQPLVPGRLQMAIGPLVSAGVLDASDVAVAEALTDTHVSVNMRVKDEPTDASEGAVDNERSDSQTQDKVALAIALVTMARRLGHSCLELSAARVVCESALGDRDPGSTHVPKRSLDTFAFPELQAWTAALIDSDLVEVENGPGLEFDCPLVFDPGRGRLWLARYASYEQDLAARLIQRALAQGGSHPLDQVEAAAQQAFGETNSDSEEQLAAVVHALTHRLSFITGGPGTGKTTTVATLVDAAMHLGVDASQIALAAPTGKAAERLNEGIGEKVRAITLHRLLGARPGVIERPGTKTLANQLVIVDETSMIDLPMMARLVGAVRDDAHLVLVGDPDQLISVEVGSFLRDVIEAAGEATSPLHDVVRRLTTVHRQVAGSPIHALAGAIRDGRSDEVVELLSDDEQVSLQLVEPGDGRTRAEVIKSARAMVTAAVQGNVAAAFAAAHACRVLTATRRDPGGLGEWSKLIREALGFREGEWKVGRPVMVTRNDPANGLSNGDTGIAMAAEKGRTVIGVSFGGADGPRYKSPSVLGDFEDWWAMTIHKSQGSEYDHVVVSLPENGSPMLTRELLYTAVTRAKTKVTVMGTAEVVKAAVAKQTARASGLADRLGGS